MESNEPPFRKPTSSLSKEGRGIGKDGPRASNLPNEAIAETGTKSPRSEIAQSEL
jgi:hypothetical protein